MKKHRLGTEPKEVLFRSDSILRLARSNVVVKSQIAVANKAIFVSFSLVSVIIKKCHQKFIQQLLLDWMLKLLK